MVSWWVVAKKQNHETVMYPPTGAVCGPPLYVSPHRPSGERNIKEGSRDRSIATLEKGIVIGTGTVG